ncbi:MAG: carbohydrate-binding domain-containing protein [Tannerellaceae bacterium]|jgi:hypothetical protein|nr:carbohydrate-binding domain-containing protein [Tannerellaceae bacterium]
MNKLKFLTEIFAVAIMLASCSESSEKIVQMFNVGGKITKSDGGAAEGASVALVNAFDGSNAGEAPANAAGEYVLTGVGAGNYKIVAALNGYETMTVDEIKVVDSDVTVNEIILQKITVPTYTLSGSVYKPDGSAASGASVHVKRTSDNVYVGQGTIADASGTYSIGNIPSGNYTLIIMLEGYETGTLADVKVNGSLTALNITLQAITVNENAVNIVFSGNSVTISNLPADGSVSASKKGADVTIASTATGTIEYFVTGSTTGGSLKIQNNAAVANTLKLTLSNATIASSSSLPPVQITKNEGVTIVELKGNSVLSDNSSNEENATLISKSGSLVFEGYGKLSVGGAAKHAVASSKKSIAVRGGEIVVASAASDGFHSEEGFEISGGSLDISASGDGIDAGTGSAIINGGNIRINSRNDDTKGVKADAGIIINGGSVDLNVAGAQSKGISSKADIVVNNGNISVATSGAAVLNALGSGYDPSYCTAIKSDANIIVSGGSIKIECLQTADGGKGLSADGNVEIRSGSVEISTAGDGKVYTTESGTVDSYTAACIKSNKNIMLTGGNISCRSTGTGGKGINADEAITIGVPGAVNADLVLNVSTSGERFLVSGNTSGGQGGGRPGGGFGGSSADYANPKAIKCEGNMTINSGTVTINCTQKSEGGEGLESKAVLTINGGNIDIHTYDDCINAGTSIVINNGNVFCSASGQDAIDSNGTLAINGGLIIANGVRGDGEAFDADRNVQVNGGIIVGTCGNTMAGLSGTQRSYRMSCAVGSSIGIKNASGDILLMFTVPIIAGASAGSNVIVLFSDPRLTSGTYTLLSGGGITGGVTVNGYNTGGAYVGGTSKSFTI